MKVRIATDERYPEALLTDSRFGEEVEVDGRTLRRWRRVIAEFDAVQEEMLAVHGAALRARKEGA